MRRTYHLTYTILGALVAAPAVVSLIQHWATIPLVGTFQSILDFYHAVFGPVFTAAYAILTGFFGLWGIRFQFPEWFQDLHTLSLVAAAIHIRSDIFVAKRRDEEGVAAEIAKYPDGAFDRESDLRDDLVDLTDQVAVFWAEQRRKERLEKEAARKRRLEIRQRPISHAILIAAGITLAGLLGAGIFWLPGVLLAMIGHSTSWHDEFKARFAWATAAAVIVFYISNFLVGEVGQ